MHTGHHKSSATWDFATKYKNNGDYIVLWCDVWGEGCMYNLFIIILRKSSVIFK